MAQAYKYDQPNSGVVRFCKFCSRRFVTACVVKLFCNSRCATEHKREIKDIPEPWKENCKNCLSEFAPKTGNQIFCSTSCCVTYHKKEYKKIEWDRSLRKCKRCGLEFTPKSHNQLYCNIECCNLYYKEKWHSAKLPKEALISNCLCCGGEFISKGTNHRYCSSRCRIDYSSISNIRQAIRDSQNPILDSGLSGILFTTESEFASWFSANYFLFGISEILCINSSYPDVLCRTNNATLKVELEYHASNFLRHGHDPSGCDLIIAYASSFKTYRIAGVPVLSLLKVKKVSKSSNSIDWRSVELSPHFKSIVGLSRSCLELSLGGTRNVCGG